MTHDPARGAAVDLLDGVMGEGRLMSELSARLGPLRESDRARALRLATQTLRGLERADRLLSRNLRKKPPLTIMNVLRLGTVELCLGGDAHGVVSDLVNLVADTKRLARLKGLVNAVLRGIADGGGAPWNDLRVPQMPNWLRGQMIAAWGKATVLAIEKAHFSGAPLDLTVKDTPEDWAKMLSGICLPTGSVRLDASVQVSALPGYADGAWWVQDASSSIAARALAPSPGTRVLDLCAAPGGKTLQLAHAGADVTAVDISDARMTRLSENLARTGLQARCLTRDAFDFNEGPFDAILLDAPCSATGTIRRHPDLPFAKRGLSLAPLCDLQARLIDHAAGLLSPGGRLLYCTCSLLPAEGEDQAKAACSRLDGLTVDPGVFRLPGIDRNWTSSEGGLRLRPDHWADIGGMDGFYMACLVKA
ncbi:MAG: RsmB/NOP family class I SAM-dependent RNA methyltransferase [Pseudomonadota bacterium]